MLTKLNIALMIPKPKPETFEFKNIYKKII